jgi:mono/diheme cytochrome c family protein
MRFTSFLRLTSLCASTHSRKEEFMSLSASNFPVVPAAGLALSIAVFVACGASTPRGASDASLAQAKASAAGGAQLYEQSCSKCHGDRGQGLAGGPAIMGAGALPEFPDEATASGNPQLSNPGQVQTQKLTQVTGAGSRDPFKTAADVYQYISTRMPKPSHRAGSLQSGEYWQILNFVLISHGTPVPPGGVNEGNAASVPLPR